MSEAMGGRPAGSGRATFDARLGVFVPCLRRDVRTGPVHARNDPHLTIGGIEANLCHMDEEVARISQGGRVVIPARIRKALGVTVGDRVVLRVANGQMTLVTTERALQEAQALVRRYVPKGRSLVGELIRERRRAAARE